MTPCETPKTDTPPQPLTTHAVSRQTSQNVKTGTGNTHVRVPQSKLWLQRGHQGGGPPAPAARRVKCCPVRVFARANERGVERNWPEPSWVRENGRDVSARTHVVCRDGISATGGPSGYIYNEVALRNRLHWAYALRTISCETWVSIIPKTDPSSGRFEANTAERF